MVKVREDRRRKAPGTHMTEEIKVRVCLTDHEELIAASKLSHGENLTGYARDCMVGLDGLSWAILKGRTGNRAGTVTLASANPRDAPQIEFRNFAEHGDADLAAVVRGIGIARDLARPLRDCGAIAEELLPGDEIRGPALSEWARSNAWGHHACGTAAIGPVLDNRLRVRGVRGLRVVDASIFPRIPGFFIVAAIYQAAEKAADMILEDSP